MWGARGEGGSLEYAEKEGRWGGERWLGGEMNEASREEREKQRKEHGFSINALWSVHASERTSGRGDRERGRVRQ